MFYGLLVLAGITNYLPTRYGPAAVGLGGGLVLEYLGLTRTEWTAHREPWCGRAWPGCRGRASGWRGGAGTDLSAGRNSLERLWFGFRDRWGVVWALRTQERFNRAAELARWPFRLTWFGLAAVDPDESGRVRTRYLARPRPRSSA